MNRRKFISLSSLSLLSHKLHGQVATVLQSGIVAPVLMRAYDNNRTGANLKETILSQSSIRNRGIKKLFSLPMEGDARGSEAQPLLVPSVKMPDGSIRDVVITTSMNNTVWCYDANSSDILWVKKLGIPVNGGKTLDWHFINDHWGLLSTGVIDPDTNIWYGVSWESPNGMPANATNYIHALNISDGSLAKPSVSLAGVSYTTAKGITEYYKSTMRKQRSSLVMTNVAGVKTIFFCCGTVSEYTGGAAGWIIAYDIYSNTISAAMSTTSGDGAGIWMGGQGLCADSNGFLYGMTGNGSFDGIEDFGECIFKVKYTPANIGGAPPGPKLEIVDWWSPYTDAGRVGQDPTLASPAEKMTSKMSGVNAPTANGHMPTNMASDHNLQGAVVRGHLTITKPAADATYGDEDLGSAGVSLIPEYGLVLGAGKDGIAYLVKMNNMGKTKPADFANAAVNYNKLAQPPVWYTYFPGFNVNAAPQDSSTLDFLYDGKTRHMHSTSVRYNSAIWGMMLFCWGENSSLRAWQIKPDGTMTFLAQSAEIASAQSMNSPGGMPGGFMCLSANGQTKGSALLWASIPYGDANTTITNGRLLCYDPENFVNTLADGTKQISVLWDSQNAGLTYLHSKFNTPVVSGGKVYLPTYEDETIVLG